MISDSGYKIEHEKRGTGDGMVSTGWIAPSTFPALADLFDAVGFDARITIELPDTGGTGGTHVYTLQTARTTWEKIHPWR